MLINVSIPDRVLGIFRRCVNDDSLQNLTQKVSIPDRVLGIFRLAVKQRIPEILRVSIPDRVLGIFRLNVLKIRTKKS